MTKNIILSLAVALLFTACAQPTWEGQSQSEITSWRKAGVTVDDLQKYLEAKMNASDVLAWKDSGFKSVDSIIAWKDANFTPSNAKKWNDKSITLDSAKEWVKNNFSFEEAIGWMDAKFSLKEAIANRAKGLVPNS